MATFSAKEALNKYLTQLLELPIPMDDPLFESKLTVFFTGDQHDATYAEKTVAKQAYYFLMKVIARNVDQDFKQLLDIMEDHDKTKKGAMYKLALEIKEDMGK